jgi:hypothetical protein
MHYVSFSFNFATVVTAKPFTMAVWENYCDAEQLQFQNEKSATMVKLAFET